MRYLIDNVVTYRVPTMTEVEQLQEQFKKDSHGTLISFNYKLKTIKQKGEIVDEYYLVSIKQNFNNEKEPEHSYFDLFTEDEETCEASDSNE